MPKTRLVLPVTQEVWVITEIQPVSPRTWGAKMNLYPTRILQGFHPGTRELLHTYGPFKSSNDLLEFVAVHGISLP